ncbi:MAG: hypothetical protein RL596_225 [Bacteroidota bacterium]
MKRILYYFVCIILTANNAVAQEIVFSDPDRDDPKTLSFEIVGKVGGNILIHKNTRDIHQFSVYDIDMKLIEKSKVDFFPDRAKVLSTEFLNYGDFTYLFYQYQLKNMVYAMAIKLNGNGKKIGDPIQLDTTGNINYTINNRIYTYLFSEDKQRIMALKISTRNDKEHIVTSCLFDKSLQLIEKVKMPIAMPERNDFLGEFGLDNEGTLICLRESGTGQNDNINKISLVVRKAGNINPTIAEVKVANIFLDDTRVKIDNKNKKYLICSFFSKMRKGNVDGLYYVLWDKETNKQLLNSTTTFSNEFREEVRAEENLKAAFNEFYLKNIILRKDGGFMIIAESAYVSSRGNSFNRWDYMNRSPFINPYAGFGMMGGPLDFYAWNSPIGLYPWGTFGGYGWGNGFNNFGNSNITRYFAENIAVISFEPDGKMEWSNVIRKTQYDDNTDNYIGYGLVNAGAQLHFLFNIQDKRTTVLTDQSLSPDGKIDRNPTVKNLDKGFDFMPRHAKQIGSRSVVMPCMYRGFTCFAKIEFN